MLPALLSRLAALSLAGAAAAQSLNVDVGDNTILFPAPSNGYGAAAQQPGKWNAVKTPYSAQLLGLGGMPSGVSVSSSGTNAFATPFSGLSGDDKDLMADCQSISTFSGTVRWTFSGLAAGSYRVYTFAWDPSGSGAGTEVSVIGSSDPLQVVGGSWGGSPHVFGTTYALHHAGVSGGTLEIDVAGHAGSSGSVNGFQLVQESSVSIYGTAKVNSLGCTPSIGSSGLPSASSPSPFLIGATQVINNKLGILFYGFASASTPFQGGWLLVAPPLTRTALQGSGGNPPPNDCSGSFSYDFNARIQGGMDPQLVAGATVYAQYWYRDPQAASTTGLTDGLQFVIAP
jgi:hypothetical protein